MQVVKFYAYSVGAIVTVTGLPMVCKEWYAKKFTPPETKYEGKTVVISGATSGIGFKAAEEFAKLKAKVVMLCRDESLCIQKRRKILTASKNGQIYCAKVDFESLSSVRQCAERLNKVLDKVDILINSAGVMRLPKRTMTGDNLEKHMAINHFAHFLFTNLMLDKLKASDDGRILNLTCQDYKKGAIDFDNLNLLRDYDPSKAYEQSKYANVLFTKELAERLAGTNVISLAVRPLQCHTQLKRHLPSSQNFLIAFFPRAFHWFFEFTLPQTVQAIKYAALDPSLKDNSKSGMIVFNCQKDTFKPNGTLKADAKKLWLVSEKWTGLK